jgi:hypothetical protein
VLKISPTTVIHTLKKRACTHRGEPTAPQRLAS